MLWFLSLFLVSPLINMVNIDQFSLVPRKVSCSLPGAEGRCWVGSEQSLWFPFCCWVKTLTRSNLGERKGLIWVTLPGPSPSLRQAVQELRQKPWRMLLASSAYTAQNHLPGMVLLTVGVPMSVNSQNSPTPSPIMPSM